MSPIDPVRAASCGLVACIVAFAGCAATPTTANGPADVDPWEPANRRIDHFNTEVDEATLKPIAKGYNKAIPEFVRRRVSNFSTNLRGPLNIANSFLQGKGADGFSATGRFLANSTFGILGLFDVASKMGLDKQSEDFGQTLAVWGVPDGPYVIVPFFGPQTLRDALALPLDFLADPLFWYENTPVRYSLYALRTVDLRTRYLAVEEFVEESYDPYIAVRESYLQHRHFEIHDGNPPVDEGFYDDLPDPE